TCACSTPPRSSTACCPPRSADMADTPAARPRRRRRWLRALMVLLALGALGAFAVHRYTRPQRITALLVERVRSDLGAELRLGGDAGYALLPGLRAVLPQPELVVGGTRVLHADAMRAAVPWHALWSSQLEIERIELVRPELDLDALHAWLAARPPSTSPLPDVRFVLHVEDGRVLRAGVPIAEGVTIDLANRADLVAWLRGWKPENADVVPPISGSLHIDSARIGDTRIEGLEVEVRDDAPGQR
ncbi:hypothetical protein, partial [Dokdonella sp.]|uniref:hypothetical protein n=1 Tax=Dokdonella sp. TaxID=2291710 RepID=UPI002F3FAFB6